MEMKYTTSFWDENLDMWKSKKDTYDVFVANRTGSEAKGAFKVSKMT